MEKITLNEYLKQGSVVENLKNFVGVTPENTMGLMTPERLAAVAGGILSPFKLHREAIRVETDLNLLEEEGIYISNLASTLLNAPSDINTKSMVVIIVVPFTSGQFTQILICGDTMYTREKVISFSEWLKIGTR